MHINAICPTMADYGRTIRDQLYNLCSIMMLEAIIQSVAIPRFPLWVCLFINIKPTLAAIRPERIMLTCDDLHFSITIQVSHAYRMRASYGIHRVHFPYSVARVLWLFKPGNFRVWRHLILEIQHLSTQHHIRSAIPVYISNNNPCNRESLNNTMRLECSISQVFKPIGTGYQIQLAVAINIIRNYLLTIRYICQNALGPWILCWILRNFKDLRTVAISCTVITNKKRQLPAGENRCDSNSMRPIAIANADGGVLPTSDLPDPLA